VGDNDYPEAATTPHASDRHEEALCAFCRKGKELAGPLVESAVPAIYICYACARLCAHVVEEECKLRSVPVPDW
jgi:hypothetical protein